MVTKIRPATTETGTSSSTTWDFEILAWTEANGWTVHAHGQIEPEFTGLTVDTPTLKASLPLVEKTEDLVEQDLAYAYAVAGVRTTRYGPTFQNSTGFFEGKGYTLLEHKLRDLGGVLKDQPPTAPTDLRSPSTRPRLTGFSRAAAHSKSPRTEEGRRRCPTISAISASPTQSQQTLATASSL